MKSKRSSKPPVAPPSPKLSVRVDWVNLEICALSLRTHEPTTSSSRNNLEKKIDRSTVTSPSANQQQVPREIDYSGPEPNENNSKSTGSSSIGFCYIGEYDGTRSCASVNESSKCMSGDIFPSKDICVNPSLRE